jgi:hypothetical protein
MKRTRVSRNPSEANPCRPRRRTGDTSSHAADWQGASPSGTCNGIARLDPPALTTAFHLTSRLAFRSLLVSSRHRGEAIFHAIESWIRHRESFLFAVSAIAASRAANA